MEVFFALLLMGMLIMVGYAKVQQGVAKTIGQVSFEGEDD
jgi:hypothetical protein